MGSVSGLGIACPENMSLNHDGWSGRNCWPQPGLGQAHEVWTRPQSFWG